MKIDLTDSSRKILEEFFGALVSYHLDGRLMIFQGLLSHKEMQGAINVIHSIIGWDAGNNIIKDIKIRKSWKYKDLNEAYLEFDKSEHHCFYCDKIKD
jgi:hypothetical protein